MTINFNKYIQNNLGDSTRKLKLESDNLAIFCNIKVIELY